RPWVLVGWFWYLVAVLPVSGLVQIGSHSMADRYTYVPQIGLTVLGAWGAIALAGASAGATRVFGAAGALAAGACLVLAAREVRWWRNSETLFRHAIDVTGPNYLAEYSLGEALARAGAREEARVHLVSAAK